METEFGESRRGRVIERINQRLQVLDYQTLLKPIPVNECLFSECYNETDTGE